ncbi:regulatory protein RecX [Fusibacter ferrireducens]|uniref:Regulatory protein RecX n=1 Tax=Fusibacter ferrireducens TaxID=2785058 RepID=A0ABR9ZXX9_9FIRM|nr:regulatory protein RecX [Fusibacter ferrireducens]MBF4695309.1 regulatory protein RecX [Fusibacter ferrireducens]
MNMNKEEEKWLNYAFYLLSFKMRTEHELIEKFNSRQVDEDIQQLVLSFLKSQKYIDDQFYAESYIESHASKYGPYRMKRTLKEKGISKVHIEKAFEALASSIDPYKDARNILQKKMDGMSIDFEKLKDDYVYKRKIQQKLSQFLAYRGFSLDVIKCVLSELLAQEFFDEE